MVDPWSLEESFWTEGAAFYERWLAPSAWFLFPQPVGRMNREQAIDSISHGPRWKSVSFDSCLTLRAAPSVLQLVYLARAERGDAESPYEALCSSTYIERDGDWFLSLHQQTPASSTG